MIIYACTGFPRENLLVKAVKVRFGGWAGCLTERDGASF